jgi:hypothetical protein
VHRALRDLLGRLAAPRPLVLWLDDLHWADPGSLDALAALVYRAARWHRAAGDGGPRGPAAATGGNRARRPPRGRSV